MGGQGFRIPKAWNGPGKSTILRSGKFHFTNRSWSSKVVSSHSKIDNLIKQFGRTEWIASIQVVFQETVCRILDCSWKLKCLKSCRFIQFCTLLVQDGPWPMGGATNKSTHTYRLIALLRSKCSTCGPAELQQQQQQHRRLHAMRLFCLLINWAGRPSICSSAVIQSHGCCHLPEQNPGYRHLQGPGILWSMSSATA